MADAELGAGWPELGTVVAGLRRIVRGAIADPLANAMRSGATSGEILGGIGVVLCDHRAVRWQLGEAGASAWDAVMADVNRAFPGSRLGQWLGRFRRREI